MPLSAAVLGATLYVESFGEDAGNQTCRKATPCQTVSHALEQGGPNSTIVVGPGTFPEPLAVTYDNVRIRSVAGAYATRFVTDATEQVFVEGRNFALGSKGRGFTLEAVPQGAEQSGILIFGDRARVEGNVIAGGDDDFTETADALFINGSRPIVRYNSISGYRSGLGFSNFDDDAGVERPVSATVSHNIITGIGENCLVLVAPGKSHDKVTNNRIAGCGVEDDYFPAVELLYPPEPPFSKPRIANNTIRFAGDSDTAGGVIYGAIYVDGGSPIISNNFLSDIDLSAISLWFTRSAKVQNNLIRNAGDGLAMNIINDVAVVTGNTILDSDVGVLINDDFPPFRTFSKNNFIGNIPCPIFNSIDVISFRPIVMSRNFWGDLTGATGFEPDLPGSVVGCENDNALTLYNRQMLQFRNPARTLNPVKFRSEH